MPDLAILIVSWNCLDDLAECLASLKSGGVTIAHRVIVVDNASDDGTVEFVSSVHPDVQLVANRENIGFAAANNQALRLARSRYVVLLNPDTVVRHGALDALVHWMDQHPAAWACGPAMLNTDGTPQRTGVRFPTVWGLLVETFFLDRLFPRSRVFGRHRELYEDPKVARRVDYVQGSCLLVRADVLHRVGILDEEFFLYFEETDWCYRMSRDGGEVWYVPDGEVVHHGGGSFAHFDERRLVYYFASLFQFFHKHSPTAAGIAVRFVVLLRAIIRVPVWLVVATVRPAVRRRALSTARGYMRVALVACGRRPL